MKTEILKLIENAKAFDKTKNFASLAEIVDKYKKEEYHTKPGKLSLKNIKSTSETAYQRAIFLSKETTLNTLGKVTWNDLELPVVFSNSPRRRCVDLIGKLNNKTPVLCELKFTSSNSYYSNSPSPIYAVVELLIYYYLIKDNCEELDKKEVFHKDEKVISFKWSDFNSNSIFIIVANEKYWDYWLKRYEKQKNEIRLWLKSLPLKVCFFSSADFNFKEQKGNQEKYSPSVLEKTEWTEVFCK